MRSQPLSRRIGAPPTRRAASCLPVALAVLTLLCACGRDDRPSRGPADAPSDPIGAGRPLATYRLASTRSTLGDSLTIEAIAPCHVWVGLEQGGTRQGGRSRDLEPGEAVRVEWWIAPVERPTGAPSPGAEPAAGAGDVSHRLRFGLDDENSRETRLVVRPKSPSPWVRTAAATIPISPRPFPRDGVVLAAVAVADLTAHAGLSLVLEPTPIITGAPVGTPADALQLACLWVRVTPR